jgi:hypothetical protein
MPIRTVSIQHRQNEIRRYLLGDASQREEERSAIEQAYLENIGAYKDLLEIEDELIDEYVFGRLGEDEAALFQHSLKNSPRRQEKVELATALREYATQPSRRTRERASFRIPLSYRIAAACGICALAGAAAWAVYSLRMNRINQPALVIAKREQPPNLQTPPTKILRGPIAPPENPSPKTSPAPFLSFVLIPDLVRGNSEQTQVALLPGRYMVQLRMEREDEPYSSYEATVSTPGGRNIAHQDNLKPNVSGRNRTLRLDLSSEILRPGVYILNLKGQTTDGQRDDLDDYTFQVVRR